MQPLPYTQKLQVDLLEREAELTPFWAALGFDHFHDIARPEVQTCWRQLKQLGVFRGLRCHGILRRDELHRSDWENFADQRRCLDIVLDAGIRPVVELSRIPDDLANPDHPRGFGGDVDRWCDVVRQLVRVMIETYGLDEVRQWPFEFWNEPDHHMWAGNEPLAARRRAADDQVADYLQMYDRTVRAVKEACPQLNVGGPAISGNTLFMRRFLEHCRQENSPLDFISFHCYSNSPDREPCLANMTARVAEMREVIGRTWTGPAVPLLMDEWGLTWGGGRTVEAYPLEHRNSLTSAAFTLKLVKELIRHDLQMALYWGFSEHCWYHDERFGHHDFDGKRTLFTRSGIPRPVLGAYRILGRLHRTVAHTHRLVDTNTVDALATVDDGVRVGVWDHDPDARGARVPSTTEIVIDGFPAQKQDARMTLEGYTVEHNTYDRWLAAGQPDVPEGASRESILEAAEPKTIFETTAPVEDGCLSTGQWTIHPGEVYLLTVE